MFSLSSRRPLFITVLCSFYFVYWALAILPLVIGLTKSVIGGASIVWSDVFNQIAPMFLGVQIEMNVVAWLIVAGLVAGIVGYWLFQKWAVIVYGASTVALFVLILSVVTKASGGTPIALVVLEILLSVFVVNIAMMVSGVIYFKKMK